MASDGSRLEAGNDLLRGVAVPLTRTATTRVRYSRVVRHFIGTCLDGDTGWAGLSVQRVTEFVREETASKKGCGRRAPMSAVRSFLRFLTWRGIVPAGLDRAIPRTRGTQAFRAIFRRTRSHSCWTRRGRARRHAATAQYCSYLRGSDFVAPRSLRWRSTI